VPRTPERPISRNFTSWPSLGCSPALATEEGQPRNLSW
jgi:hypothetical protein